MATTTDPEEARLLADVKAATAAYCAAERDLTPGARLEMAGHRARGPFGRHDPTPEQAATQRLARTFRDADKALRLARVALNSHRRQRREAERQAGLDQLAERTARKDAERAARGPGNVQPLGVSYGRPR